MMNKICILSLLMMTISITSFCQNGDLGESFTLTVSEPADLAGDYFMSLSTTFGAAGCASEISGEIVLGAAGTDTEGCANVRTMGLDVDGKIAMVDRGSCTFIEKAEVAQDFGAIAIIICNNVENDTLLGLGAGDEDLMNIDITIPAFSMTLADCTTLKANITNGITVSAKRLDIGANDPSSSDVVLWSEDFTGGFNGWTNEGIFCSAGVDPSMAEWQWRDNGDAGQGAFVPSLFEPFTVTPCDGFVIFDSDLLDNDGNENGGGSGQCPSGHTGALVSPVIDVPATANSVGIKFSQTLREFDSNYLVEWSIDAGTNWTSTSVNRIYERFDIGVNIVRIPLQGVSGGDQLQVRFVYDGDYFFWAVDDVQIIEFTGANLRIDNTFYTPLSYAAPTTHTDADPFSFATDIINDGTVALDATLTVTVYNQEDGEIVHTDMASFTGIQPGDTLDSQEAFIEEFFVPNDLDIGVYTMEYFLEATNADEAYTFDNLFNYSFQITENRFSKIGSDQSGPSITSASRFRTTDEQWGVGAVYGTSANDGKYKAHAIEFGVAANSALQNYFVELALLKSRFPIEEGLIPDDFNRDESSFLSHPDLEVVWQNTHVFTNESNFDVVSIDLIEEDILLDPGSVYVVMAFFDDSATSDSGLPNKDLFININNQVQGTGLYILLPDQSPAWFTCCGFGFNQAPMLDLVISLTSPVDDVPLPEASFRILPNPVSETAFAEMSFEQPVDVSLIIATIDGKVLSVDEFKSVGNETKSIDVSSLPNGSYLMRIATEEGTKTRQVIIQH